MFQSRWQGADIDEGYDMLEKILKEEARWEEIFRGDQGSSVLTSVFEADNSDATEQDTRPPYLLGDQCFLCFKD